MAYEKVKLVVASLSGEIYMARINKDGTMSDSRRNAKEDVLRATTEWFMTNKKKMVSYGQQPNGETPSLFYTSDKEKIERILEILQEDDQ